jgi:iron complex transport system substrate-binding protein
VPIYVSDPATLGALFKNIEHLGKLTGKMKEAHSLILEMRSRITSIQKSLRGIPHRRVLYILWHDPLMTVGPGSFIHELIETAGGRNIYSKTGIPYTQFSMEEVIAKDPEVIFFPDELGESAIQSQKAIWKKRWGMLSAVKAGKLFTANSDLLHRPGPRIVEGLELLAHTIHPEVFGDEIQTTHP